MSRVLAGLSCLVMLTACGRGATRPPNLVLFVLDTVRADSISANGHPVELTPTIDRLAAEGVNFRRAFSHSSWTKPSIATLFTARYPDNHRVRTPVETVEGRQVTQRLHPRFRTLAERLNEAGYVTAAFVNQIHLRPKFGFDQGFDHYFWSTGHSAHQVNDTLVEWIEQRPQTPEGPLFLYVHYLDPHWPYRERVDELRDAIGPIGVDPPPPGNGNRVDDWLAGGLAPGSMEGLRARYDHGVAHTDRAVGFALAILRRHGVLDNAVVVVTSDHGEGFLEHGKLQHGYAPFEEVVRVPLVVWRTPPSSARVVEQSVGLIDVMPTLLDLAGLEPTEPGDEGRSLLPLLEGGSLADRSVYLETLGIRGLRTARAKVLAYPDGRLDFYDLGEDPAESRSLPCQDPCTELTKQLDELSARSISGDAASDEAVGLDEEDLEQLRALGYLND